MTASLTEEEKDQMSRIDEETFELSNGDVILARPGCVIRKTWRIVNTAHSSWPDDTRIVSVTKGLCMETPDIIHKSLLPNGILDVSIKIFVPDEAPAKNHMF